MYLQCVNHGTVCQTTPSTGSKFSNCVKHSTCWTMITNLQCAVVKTEPLWNSLTVKTIMCLLSLIHSANWETFLSSSSGGSKYSFLSSSSRAVDAMTFTEPSGNGGWCDFIELHPSESGRSCTVILELRNQCKVLLGQAVWYFTLIISRHLLQGLWTDNSDYNLGKGCRD